MATIPQKELRNHVGEVLRRAEETRALRMRRLGTIEDHCDALPFDALPFDAAAARECGRLPPSSRNAVEHHVDEHSTSRSPPPPTSMASHC